MVRIDFSHQWIELIMRCISSVSYSFLINGTVLGSISPGRGLRQDDPLSPYLFVICAQGLCEMLVEYEQRKLFRGVSIATNCPTISHLFFADDSLIFFIGQGQMNVLN